MERAVTGGRCTSYVERAGQWQSWWEKSICSECSPAVRGWLTGRRSARAPVPPLPCTAEGEKSTCCLSWATPFSGPCQQHCEKCSAPCTWQWEGNASPPLAEWAEAGSKQWLAEAPLNPPDQAGAPTLHWGPEEIAPDLCRLPWMQSKAQTVLFEASTAKPLLIHLDGGDRNVQSSKLPNYRTGQILDQKNSPHYQCDSESVFKCLKRSVKSDR